MNTTTEFQLDFTVLDDAVLPAAAIIVAAGSGSRIGINKQFAPLLGIPILARSMLAFQQTKEIRDIIVVTREHEIADVQTLADTYQISKLTAIVAGGSERQTSVENGLAALCEDILYVAIHDGARPLVTPVMIEHVLQDAKNNGAATLAVPVKNTIKQVENGRIIHTPKRETLWAVQTPQVFDVAIYQKALDLAKQDKLMVTDDCSICEHAGYPVTITPGDYCNLKITTPEDLWVAEAFLKEGKSE